LGNTDVVAFRYGIPPAPRGLPQVEVRSTITERQVLPSAYDSARKTDLQIQRAPTDVDQSPRCLHSW